ncbi:MAG TPA: head GIN domain-containing protein [Burkholderiaceae bacterium]|nr:head GIN domain-containing protein [Burkholderiaceae bacterium]
MKRARRQRLQQLGGLCVAAWTASITTSSAAAQGRTQTRVYDQLGAFSAVVLDTTADFKLRQGNENRVTVTAEPKVLERIAVEQQQGRLRVFAKAGYQTQLPLVVEIVFRELSRLELNGSGDVELQGLRGARLDLVVNSSGSIALRRLNLKELAADIGGSGSVVADGETVAQRVSVGGSGSYDGEALKSVEAEVSISGAGDAVVHAAKQLAVRIDGAGSVRYRGDPQVRKSISGVGSVEKV